MKSFSEIKQIYAAHPREFDLERFQYKFLQLIRRWTDLVLPIPELSKLNYGSVSADVPPALQDKENVREAPGADIAKLPSSFEDSANGKQQQRQRKKRQCDRKPPPASIATSFENEVEDAVESSTDFLQGKMGAREVLKRKRKAFMKNVNDPLPDCVAKAQSARTRRQEGDESEDSDEEESSNYGKDAVKTPSFRKRKKSAYKLTFTDSSDSDDSKEEGKALSEVPARYQPAQQAQAPRQIHVSQKVSSGNKRRKFTEVEDGAIRNGVERFGMGKWADIKAYYSMELKDRNQVQIKDRWRTLNK